MGDELGIVWVVIVLVILVVSQWWHRKRQRELVEMFTAHLEGDSDEDADRTRGDGRFMDESDLVDDDSDLLDDPDPDSEDPRSGEPGDGDEDADSNTDGSGGHG